MDKNRLRLYITRTLTIAYMCFVFVCAADSTFTAPDAKDSVAQNEKPETGSGDVIVVEKTGDTVYVLDKSFIKDYTNTVKDKVDELSDKGFGVCGGPYYGVLAVNIKPVKRLCERDPFLSEKTFHFSRYSYEPFGVYGGMALVGIGNSVRVGGGGMHAKKSVVSDKFNGDSLIAIDIDLAIGGFIFEKAKCIQKWNIKAGGCIGGGNMEIKASIGKTSSVFDDDYDEDKKVKAHIFSINPYIGASYSFFRIFHVGVDVSLPILIAVDGFSPWVSDFYSANPGIMLKIIFGNLG